MTEKKIIISSKFNCQYWNLSIYISIKIRIENILYVAQMINTINIIIAYYIKNFTLKIRLTKYNQINNIVDILDSKPRSRDRRLYW